MLLHEFKNANRNAEIYRDEQSGHFVVVLKENDLVMDERVIHNKTERYAEDLAENWVMKFGEFNT